MKGFKKKDRKIIIDLRIRQKDSDRFKEIGRLN